MAKIIMYSSNFSKYGMIQALKSTLGFLVKDAGHQFIFVNDPNRVEQVKIKFGNHTVLCNTMTPKQINIELKKLEDKHQ